MTVKVIKRTLQDIGGRRFIDDFCATFARHVDFLDQDALNRIGRQALVPHQNRQVDIFFHLVDERVNPMAGFPNRTVKLTREANDDAPDILLGDD